MHDSPSFISIFSGNPNEFFFSQINALFNNHSVGLNANESWGIWNLDNLDLRNDISKLGFTENNLLSILVIENKRAVTARAGSKRRIASR